MEWVVVKIWGVKISALIEERKASKIDKIIIKGLKKTREEAVLRELLFKSGDPYNQRKIDRSIQRLRSIGIFSSIDISKTGLFFKT